MTSCNGISVLLVEDEFLIALDAEQILRSIGAASVEIAASWARAMERASDGAFDLAVLDVNINGKLSYDIANVLKRRAIPTVFASGYELRSHVPPHLKDMARVTKPYTTECLRDAVLKALAGPGKSA